MFLPNTCAACVANQRDRQSSTVFPRYKGQGHGQQNTDFWPRPRMSRTSTAQLKLRTHVVHVAGRSVTGPESIVALSLFFSETRFYFSGARCVGLTFVPRESL